METVLGCGNQVCALNNNVLHSLFMDNRPVLLKMNPCNSHLGPHLESAFAPLVNHGVLRFVYGGLEVGKAVT